MANLKEKLKDVPKSPGVYQFIGADGSVLYVGKAKNLRARIGQYLSGHDTRGQIPFLLREAADFSYTVVNNELESLFLENTIIKQYLPRYNIMLRDDKNYAFIKIDYSSEIPQIGYARRVDNQQLNSKNVKKLKSSDEPSLRDPSAPRMHSSVGMTPRAKFFGPYSAAHKIRNTLNLLRRIFPFCAAERIGNRPCFYYYLHRCPGVCVGKVSLDEYRQYVNDKIAGFLAGDTSKIKRQLETEMKQASANQEFEKAARLRDQCNALQLLEERQAVIMPKAVSWDAISMATDSGYTCVNLFKVREGKLRDKENFVYALPGTLTPTPPPGGEGDVLPTFLEHYYLEASDVPKCIYTQTSSEDPELIEHIIRTRFNRKADIVTPQKGKPAELIKLGVTNAEEYLKNWLAGQAGHLDKINEALNQLKEVLHLEKIPQRIECYDISNIQGTNAVGSMVVFVNGLPKKSEYRKFKIKTKQTPDDFAMMKEILARRLARIMNNELGIMNKNSWPLPDLIVIDGGKGQLGVAYDIIHNSKFLIPVIGLAKRIEEIFLSNNPVPIILDHNQPGLQLLQRLRDEAHRFGITYHRQLRSKQAVKSALDDIAGIGPKTKKLLKQKFGTVAAIRKASADELLGVVGEKLTEIIKRSL